MVLSILKIGSTGDTVRYLQESLTELGYNPGPIDGLFGTKTETGVRTFQTVKGLVVDGIVGNNTWTAIDQAVNVISVSYQGHVQNIGWQKWVSDGQEAGTTGKALRLEALKIKLVNVPAEASIKYQAYVQNIGWQKWVSNGQEAGTDGKSLRMEAIKIILENILGYSIQYQAHVQNIGWQNWVSDGQEAGTDGKSLRMEAIRIRIVSNIVHPLLVNINKTTDNLIVGGTDNLAVAIIPANVTNKAVTWSSSNTLVVKVDNIGKVTAISTGTATTIVTTVDGNKTASCVITVNNPEVHPISVSINKTIDHLTIGGTDTLAVTVNPADSTNKTVTWSSSDNSIATVDNIGKVTAISVGTATITVTTVDGRRTATCIVTGNNSIVLTAVSLNKTSDTLIVGDVDNLIAQITPSNATNQVVEWSSSSAIAKVDKTGKVTAISTGIARITVTTADGNKIASCVIAVNNTNGENTFTLTNYNVSLNTFINQEMQDTPALNVYNTITNEWEWHFAKIINGQQGYTIGTLDGPWVYSQSDYDQIKQQLIQNIDPANIENDPIKIYEFLILNFSDCVTSVQLNSKFDAIGVLNGKGQIFIDAAKLYNINPIYLATHAILETGNGTSALASGIKIDGTIVYNLFGIGAYDSGLGADYNGSQYAYNQNPKWVNINAAIFGGAQWIANNYLKSQNTLYKMRWNPLIISSQYATDVNWAVNQTNYMKSCFDIFSNIPLTFDISVFI